MLAVSLFVLHPWYYVLARKTSRRSNLQPFLDFYCRCWLATLTSQTSFNIHFWRRKTDSRRTRRPHAQHNKRASILRAVVCCEEMYLSASEVQTFSWGVIVSSHFALPELCPISTTVAPQCRGVYFCQDVISLICANYLQENN